MIMVSTATLLNPSHQQESMKMETKILSPRDALVAEVFASAGSVVKEGAPLLNFKSDDD